MHRNSNGAEACHQMAVAYAAVRKSYNTAKADWDGSQLEWDTMAISARNLTFQLSRTDGHITDGITVYQLTEKVSWGRIVTRGRDVNEGSLISNNK